MCYGIWQANVIKGLDDGGQRVKTFLEKKIKNAATMCPTCIEHYAKLKVETDISEVPKFFPLLANFE